MTDYENFETYSTGDQWEYNTEMERLFKDRVVKGTKANRPTAADAPDDALYRATDEEITYRNDINDGWVEAGGVGNSSNPKTNEYFDKITVTDSGSDPSSAGEITNNGGVIKAYTDGESRDVGIPSGVITMWSGTTADVPSGWVLCDDTANGAPNLQDRFVVGAGSSYSADDTGGSDSVSLTTSELPSHDHGSGTLAVASHDHGNGGLSADSHDHGNGTLTTDHDHGPGTLAVASHSHGDGTLSADSHAHGFYKTEVSIDDGSGSTFTPADVFTDDDEFGNRTLVGTQSNGPGVSGSTGSSSPSVDSGSTASTTASVSGNTGSTSVNVSGTTSSSSPTVNNSTASTGGDGSHENRPPYYALAYIMKE